MNLSQIPYLDKIGGYLRLYLEFITPYLDELNFYLDSSGIPNATVNVPLSAVMSLFFLWLLVRLMRARRLTEKAPKEPAEKKAAEPIKTEIDLQAPDELDLEDEPDVSFMLDEGEPRLEPEEPMPSYEPPAQQIPGADEQVASEPEFDLDESEDLDDMLSFEPEPELELEEPMPEAEIEAVEAMEALVSTEVTVEEEVEEEAPKLSWFQRLKNGLSKTKDGFVARIDSILSGHTEIDDALYEDLEEVLVTADIGTKTAYELLEKTQERVDAEQIKDPALIKGIIKEEITAILDVDAPEIDLKSKHPFVIMVVGVNGTGKTTTIGKIASQYSRQGYKVLLAAADTFRAAAIEQLEVWADRVGCEIIKQKQGADPSAVAYDAIEAALARDFDVVIVDTAGRLHTKVNLMAELGKIKRVMQKKIPDAPHETFLVLDATTGNNAINQATQFNAATELSGFILTKLDGTAKGGCIVGIAGQFKLPIRFIGIGEKIDDLRPFVAKDFVDALF